HDLGKYSLEFQVYIKSVSGYDAEAHLEGPPGKVNHSSAGALHAVQRFGVHGRVLAYLIAGHHAGLPDWFSHNAGRAALECRLQEPTLLQKALRQDPPLEILDRPGPATRPGGKDPALWMRMLFSCLVDADFLDTEAFMAPEKEGQRQAFPTLEQLQGRFDTYMQELMEKAADTPVNRWRREILHRCEAAADRPPGAYSITVPTGGGKTFSSLAFALRHAKRHGRRRIIYVLPFTSIIEQTAGVFREILGEAVLEHHSNLDPEKETPKNRLACENWDAPLVVTTNVQFFESLFAARTSRVRKLHNIVNSVVVLDEAQLLPASFLKPILQVIQELVDHYGVTFVITTATQPALGERRSFEGRFPGLKNLQELMPDPEDLHKKFRRVDVQLPQDFNQPRTWDDLAEALTNHPSVLCIVNRRDDCRDLHRRMPEGTYHLSALMCGEHRSRVIADIRATLEQGKPLRVISTQLVEAGVDFDFPVVYRALAGLDSIAQAAGRCNREGRLSTGKVIVFIPPRPSPRGQLLTAEQTARQFLIEGVADPLEPGLFQKYFEALYWKQLHRLDQHGILDDLKAGPGCEIQFRTAAQKFQLIDESRSASVIVRFGESPKWIGKLEKDDADRWLLRKLQRYLVSIPQHTLFELLERGSLREVRSGLFVQVDRGLYHPVTGLLDKETDYRDPENYITG
ncbi:MAG: CRISPR-associated helicase Cas3', partial [Nitrospinaceae bacterium]